MIVSKKLPPGGGVCFECSSYLYWDKKGWHYELDSKGHAHHKQCNIGVDDVFFDDEDNLRKHERIRSAQRPHRSLKRAT